MSIPKSRVPQWFLDKAAHALKKNPKNPHQAFQIQRSKDVLAVHAGKWYFNGQLILDDNMPDSSGSVMYRDLSDEVQTVLNQLGKGLQVGATLSAGVLYVGPKQLDGNVGDYAGAIEYFNGLRIIRN